MARRRGRRVSSDAAPAFRRSATYISRGRRTNAATIAHAGPGGRHLTDRAARLFLDIAGVAFILAIGLLPWSAALFIAGVSGTLAGIVPSGKTARAAGNLRRAGVAGVRDASRRACRHMLQSLVEIAWSTCRSPAEVRRRMIVEGAGELRAAATAGKGVLVACAHVGNWEAIGHAATEAGVPVAVVARRVRAEGIGRRVAAFRARCGVRTLTREQPGAAIAAARWLTRGGVLACMIDRASSGRRVMLPFLGNATNVPLGPFQLAAWAGAAVFVACAHRLADGRTQVTFRYVTHAPEGDPIATARLVTAALEREVRARCEQWLWIYRRQPRLPAIRPAARRDDGRRLPAPLVSRYPSPPAPVAGAAAERTFDSM